MRAVRFALNRTGHIQDTTHARVNLHNLAAPLAPLRSERPRGRPASCCARWNEEQPSSFRMPRCCLPTSLSRYLIGPDGFRQREGLAHIRDEQERGAGGAGGRSGADTPQAHTSAHAVHDRSRHLRPDGFSQNFPLLIFFLFCCRACCVLLAPLFRATHLISTTALPCPCRSAALSIARRPPRCRERARRLIERPSFGTCPALYPSICGQRTYGETDTCSQQSAARSEGSVSTGFL